jgi:hypothetical protein
MQHRVLGHLIADVEAPTWQDRMTQMMLNSGTEESAGRARDRISEESNSLSRLVAEYDYLASLEPAWSVSGSGGNPRSCSGATRSYELLSEGLRQRHQARSWPT